MILTGPLEKLDSLPQPALGLLPAVHDASVVAYTTGALPAAEAGQVLRNDSADPLPLPAWSGWPAASVPPGGFAASDGRFWWPATRRGATNSYYPTAFERTIYTLPFSAYSLPLGKWWMLNRKMDARLLANNTDAVWSWVWEIGIRNAASSPAPVGPNISGYTWREPLIDLQLHLTDVQTSHIAGVHLRRYASGTDEKWEGIVDRYGGRTAATAAQLPPDNTTDFALRIRLSTFDTVDTPADPRGYVAYFITKATEE